MDSVYASSMIDPLACARVAGREGSELDTGQKVAPAERHHQYGTKRRTGPRSQTLLRAGSPARFAQQVEQR